MFKSKLNVLRWIAILPLVGELIGDVVTALKDGKINDTEIQQLGAKLVAIVASVVD